jgi:putative nucleotidyltransferase with HDIG domain
MPQAFTNRRLRPLYQSLNPPTRAARATRRAIDLRKVGLLAWGTDGNGQVMTVLSGASTRLNQRSAAIQTRPPARLLTYSIGLAALAGAVGGALTLGGAHLGNPWTIACLALVAVVAERASIRLSATLEISISLLPTLFAAVLYGPLAGMAVGAASNLLDLVSSDTQWRTLKWTTYTSTRAITGAVSGATALAVSHSAGGRFGGVVAATAVAALVAEVLDIGFAAVTRAVRRTGSPLGLLRTGGPLVAMSVPLYAPLVAILVISYKEVSPWTLPLFMAPTLAAQRLHSLYHEQRRLTEDILQVNTRLERANLSFATALVATLDARDQYTAGHSAAVAIYGRDIARRMGLSEDEQQLVHLCGLVHDIGKIGLSAGLLEKPGALTLDERRQMERHSEIGERILANVEDYTEIAAVVRHHHERVDGHGYPDGLVGAEIPLLSRIIAVADAYNAMTSNRPYRDAMPSRVARMRLAQAVESQFDTSVVAAFEAILAAAPEEYRSGCEANFRVEFEPKVVGTPLDLPRIAEARV